jgi:hypothetical protein
MIILTILNKKNVFLNPFFYLINFQYIIKKTKTMNKIYQPIVIEETENILEGLNLSGFFKDYGIEDQTFAKQHLLDIMSEKYLQSLLGQENDELFSEEEFNGILHTIIVGSLITELKEDGLMDSYLDHNNEEIFFLTDEGKIELKNIEENNGKED